MAATLLTKRYVVVTGANKGSGFETVRQLASKGIVVVLAAKRGLEALQKLQHMIGLSDHVVFHQLDVSDPSSITSFADFVKTQFGKLDILGNNAGTTGAIIDYHALSTLTIPGVESKPNRWANGVVTNDNNVLTEERVDEVVHGFLKDFKEGSLETKGWPPRVTRVSASIACVCPGFVKTDMNNNNIGALSLEEGAANLVRLALLPNGGPSGLFFIQQEVSPF